jgi:transcriptional regulator with XRE-family HTH domain
MPEEAVAAKESEPTVIELQIGGRISKLRSARGLTQDQLAAQTGFTKGYVSKIENSKVIPPIGTLVKIAQVLETDVADLLEPETTNDDPSGICLVRSWQRETVIRGGSSFGYDYVALAHKRRRKEMEPFIMVFPSEVNRDIHFEHEGEEFMFILEGEVALEMKVEDRVKTWILAPGDSMYFDSRIPHRGRSLKGESRALVVIYRGKVAPSVP